MRGWRSGRTGQLLLILLACCLLWLLLRQVGFVAIWLVLRRLTWPQLALWTCLNGLVLLIFALRWWILLHALGHSLSPFVLGYYRLIAFGVTYFTPGPQLGGEPLQVYLVSRRHQVATPDAIATVTVDKVIEMFVNFGFLLGGFILILQQGWLSATLGYQSLLYALLLFALPSAALVALWQGRHPLSALLAQLQMLLTRWGRQARFLPKAQQTIRISETQTHLLLRQQPTAVGQALLLTLVGWLLMVTEFAYATHALGLDLTLTQSVAAMVAARVAFLLPIPAGVGALESSLALALPLLGFSAADGVALSLLIRARDLLLAGVGIWLGQRVLRKMAT